MAERICTVDGCQRKHCARGLCKPHYNRMRGEKNPTTRTPCQHCGNQFEARNDELKRGKGKYCSPACYLARPQALTCSQCGDTFTRQGLGLGLSSGAGRLYCSAACMKTGQPYQAGQTRTRALRRIPDRTTAKVETFSAREIYDRDGWRCGICRQRVDPTVKWPHPRSATLDHITPLSAGGDHVRTNVQCTHWECNRSKGSTGPGQLLLVG